MKTKPYNTDIPPELKQLIADHQEAIVILVDKSDKEDYDTKVSAFVKMLDKDSKLANLLADILENLHAQERRCIQSETVGSP